MPKGPVDMYDIIWSFERFARNLRWAWFHFVKQKNMEVDSYDEDVIDDDFVMVPWYRRTDKNPPKGNAQLEAGLDRLKDYLFDPVNRRKVKDNMTVEQRQAMGQLRNLPNTSNAQVTFEDKGSRFVIRNLDFQDQLILDQLTDANHFYELPVNPTDRVIDRIQTLCSKWKAELQDFHPNVIHFLTELDTTSPWTVKGLVKCH